MCRKGPDGRVLKKYSKVNVMFQVDSLVIPKMSLSVGLIWYEVLWMVPICKVVLHNFGRLWPYFPLLTYLVSELPPCAGGRGLFNQWP